MFTQGSMAMPTPTTGGTATPEYFEVEDERQSATAPTTQWPPQQQQQPQEDQMQVSPTGAAVDAAADAAPPPRNAPPMQKRRRVTRACDECRRKKIKCDGKQPCTHCTVYSYECTFDQPSNRRRNPAPQYIEALENRLQRAEALLRTFIPSIDLSDPNFEMVIAQRKAALGQAAAAAESVRSDSSRPDMSDPSHDEDENDAQLSSMIETTGQLDIDERGHWDFHGGSSSAVFLKHIREQFDGLLGSDLKGPFLPSARAQPMFDSPHSSGESPFDSGLPNTMDLPSREVARSLASKALNCACALLRFVHGPSFYKMFDRIYDTPPENFGDEENRFLPLLYVVLALGCMFLEDHTDQRAVEEMSYQEGIDQGLKYFKAARQMMDITDCRDMPSLQAILFMILFLQSSANLSTCYSYIGIALRSALRMGLHRNLTYNFNPIERETRRRVFWIIRKMDTYVAALLGFPKMLSDQDVDQELPIEVDDEYITEAGILPMPPGKLSVFTASNAHTRLMAILAKVIREIYPTKTVEQCIPGCSRPTYVISHAKIQEIEYDLQEWLDKLPMGLRPGGEATEDIVRVQQLLRMAYAHVQMMLYRPFLHYVSAKANSGKTIDDRSYACAAACVSVSRNIVHITAEMQRRGLLIGAYWFTMYTTFFAILSLAFFVLENPTKPGSEEILANASAGRDALKALARTSMAADRCSQSLTGLFERLRIKLSESRSTLAPEKSNKRRSTPLASQVKYASSPSIPVLAQRSLTFPLHGPTAASMVSSAMQRNKEKRFPSVLSDPNLNQTRQAFELLPSGMESTGTATPDTMRSLSPVLSGPVIPSQGLAQGQGQQYYAPFGGAGLGDLSAMMFPSADPFAYPNQPMLSYDSRHGQQGKTEGQGQTGYLPSNAPDSMRAQNMFLGSNVGGGHGGGGAGVNLGYDSLEGQIFGPMAPYLVSQEGGMGMGMEMGMDLSGVTGLDPGMGGGGLTPGAGYEDMFGGEYFGKWEHGAGEGGNL